MMICQISCLNSNISFLSSWSRRRIQKTRKRENDQAQLKTLKIEIANIQDRIIPDPRDFLSADSEDIEKILQKMREDSTQMRTLEHSWRTLCKEEESAIKNDLSQSKTEANQVSDKLHSLLLPSHDL